VGMVKEAWLREMERGHSGGEGYICAKCVNDDWLKDWIADAAERKRCDFCGRRSKKDIAASFDEFVGIVTAGIHFEWNDPDNEGIMYVSAEGGYQATISDTSEVLWELEVSENDAVNEALVESIHDNGWVSHSYYVGSPSQILSWGWDHFKDVVKHESRYFFLSPDKDDFHFSAEIKPHAMLDALADVILNRQEDYEIIKTISTDTDLIRLRVDKGTRHKTAGAIGTPPAKFAIQSNRMSPAGVPMFYGAYDYKTALAETLDPEVHQGVTISAGTFLPVKELRVLDLAKLPEIPSIYDEERSYLIHPLQFLHSFAYDISKPISRDGREHIEYVPTQIVTEYFRRVFKVGNQRIDGISYRSSKAKGKVAFVLFCENEQCIDGAPTGRGDPMLRLTKARHRKL
jgi:hypothetical protein